jgi:crotonobetainyl-CoA:carnitine CoA-transferase CaiB-like acyl-CoA transferase
MFETMVSFVMTEHLWGRTFEPAEGPTGYVRLLSRERRPLPTRDGHLSVLPYLDEHWRAFCRTAGCPDLLDDRRFESLQSRLQNIDALYRTLAVEIAKRPTAEWLEVLERAGVPATPVRTLEELFDDPHLVETGFWRMQEHPTDGTMRVPAPASRFSATPADVRRLAPRLGEHTREVLREAGYDDAEIDALCAAGAARVS